MTDKFAVGAVVRLTLWDGTSVDGTIAARMGRSARLVTDTGAVYCDTRNLTLIGQCLNVLITRKRGGKIEGKGIRLNVLDGEDVHATVMAHVAEAYPGRSVAGYAPRRP